MHWSRVCRSWRSYVCTNQTGVTMRLPMKTCLSILRDAALNLWSVLSTKNVGWRYWRRIWLITKSYVSIRIWSARFAHEKGLIGKLLIITYENVPKLINAKNVLPLWDSKTRKLIHVSPLLPKELKPKKMPKTKWFFTSLSSSERKRLNSTNWERNFQI